jgi:SAM-dependent methyltransferase
VSDEPEWLRVNRANWEERTAVHLGPGGYDLAPLRAGAGRLDAIVEAELPSVAGLRVCHLQCHIGDDTLALAQRGAHVTGLDFSPAAIAAARTLAAETGLGDRAAFVEAAVYDAPRTIPPPHGFDLVFTTWGTIGWLPDIGTWARVVAALLRPGGLLYFADGHPAAWVLDDAAPVVTEGMPGFFAPYFHAGALVLHDPTDYADEKARLRSATTHNFAHPLGSVVTALIEAGLTLRWLHEHPAVTWRMFKILVRGEDRLWRWPDRPWLPLSVSLLAERRS